LLRFTDCPSPRIPLDDARSTPQNRALVTSGNGLAATAAGFRLRLGGGVALRLRSSRLSVCAPLFPARRPQTEALSRFGGVRISEEVLKMFEIKN
jgi:hypothetical protein